MKSLLWKHLVMGGRTALFVDELRGVHAVETPRNGGSNSQAVVGSGGGIAVETPRNGGSNSKDETFPINPHAVETPRNGGSNSSG